jgi:outer membrane protein TolC
MSLPPASVPNDVASQERTMPSGKMQKLLRQTSVWPFPASACLSALLVSAATPALGQPVGPPSPSLSYTAAWRQLNGVSHKLKAADHEVRAARNSVDAVRTLHRPIVALSAQALEYQKTTSINLSGPKQAFGSATDNFLNTLPNAFPPEFQDIVDQVTGKVEQAVPGLLATIPDSLNLKTRQEIFRPTATALMPIYTGGAIKATQDAAAAGEKLARAKQSGTTSLTQVDLVKTYFGQQVAEQLLAAARETREGFERHLADARALEASGMIPRARVLEAQVARDTADRAYQRAELNFQTARDDLTRLLQTNGPIVADTPLFVDSRPLPPATQYISTSVNNPRAREADAARDLARSGVGLAKSQLRPKVYAFGEYNFNHNHALATDPDWIAGVSFSYTLVSNVGRNKSVAAAREREQAAAELAADAREETEAETSRSYDLVESARRNFLLLDSSIASTEENLRVQTIAFSEGEAPISTVIDAQSSLASARAQRISVAYEYDLALAALLSASNRPDEFTDHLARADRRLAP